MEEELRRVFSVEEELEKLTKEEATIGAALAQKALDLSQARAKAAVKLKDAVDNEIHALNMKHAAFSVNFKKRFAADAKQRQFSGRKALTKSNFIWQPMSGKSPKP